MVQISILDGDYTVTHVSVSVTVTDNSRQHVQNTQN